MVQQVLGQADKQQHKQEPSLLRVFQFFRVNDCADSSVPAFLCTAHTKFVAHVKHPVFTFPQENACRPEVWNTRTDTGNKEQQHHAELRLGSVCFLGYKHGNGRK